MSLEYSANGSNPGTQYHQITFFVPQLVEQTISYVDQNGNSITDSNGKLIEPISQKGLTGQNYTTPRPTLVHGYYSDKPVNYKGVMSEFGVKGATYVRNYHNGYRVEYTEVDGEGLMNVKIYGPNNSVVREINNFKKGQLLSGAYVYRDSQGIHSIAIQNPYVEQTRNVNYVYKKLGSLVPDVPGSTPVPYPNDTDPTKPGNPVIPNILGYTPVDPSGQPLTPGDTYPVDPTKPDDDTPLHYIKNVEDIPSDSDFDTHQTGQTDVQSESVDVSPAITNETAIVALPETGESNNKSDSALVGTLVASLMSMFGLIGIAKKKKKTNDK